MISYRKREKAGDMLAYAVLIVFTLFILLPVFWLVTTSLKSEMEAFQVPPKWVFVPTLQHYREIFFFDNFGRYFVNSAIVAALGVAIALSAGVPMAYSISRFRFRGKSQVMNLNLITQVAPPVAFIVPYFTVIKTIGLLDTHFALSLVYISIILPFVIWMMRGFFEEIPPSLEESAMIDGCSRTGAFLRVTLPLAVPGLSATGIFTFILCWNEFFYALLLTSRTAKTAPVAIASYNSFEGIYWGSMTAAGTIVMLPAVIFAVVIRGALIRGMTAGAVKG